MNQKHFNGGLSPGFLQTLGALPIDRQDVKDFIDRMFRIMDSAGMRAHDLSTFQGELIGSVLGRILPGAWQGRVPPITLKGRHQKIDQFIQNNRYCGRKNSGTMLDLGCGFPPETTLDSADLLTGWTIHGSDPSMPAFVVYEPEGAYATFDSTGAMLYCQPAVPNVESWETMLSDLQTTAQRFRLIRENFGDAPCGLSEGTDGSKLIVDPKRSFERERLTFGLGGIGQIELSELDVIRCFNVLYYFDNDFYEQALEWFESVLADKGVVLIGGDWAFTTECRYILYQKEGNVLQAKEFSFSLDNVVPLGLLTFYTLHENDRCTHLLAKLVRTLRQNETFLSQYYELIDKLRADTNICARQDNGFYGSVDPEMDPGTLWKGAANMGNIIAFELGQDAVNILKKAGWNAYLNEIGLVSVSLSS